MFNHILHPRLAVVINLSQHYTRVELSLIETHFHANPSSIYIVYRGPGWSYTKLSSHLRSFVKAPPSRLLLNPGRQGRSTMFHRYESSFDLNPTTQQEYSIRIAFGNLLNILIDCHLKLLYFKVPNRPAPE